MNNQDQDNVQTLTEDQTMNREAIQNPNQSICELDVPLMIGGIPLKSIIVRKPNVKALSGVSLQDIFSYDVNALMRILPRVTTPALTPQQVLDLDPSDFAQLGAHVVNFLYPKSAQETIKEMMS